ncbi:hypothetical protein [Streptacidiphilus sp. EB129]|uniref:hypothetical protein n=1 Tax=Streptacidiphilus sp. EB129 TaxID=3156262 RepID=UPI003517C63F
MTQTVKPQRHRRPLPPHLAETGARTVPLAAAAASATLLAGAALTVTANRLRRRRTW